MPENSEAPHGMLWAPVASCVRPRAFRWTREGALVFPKPDSARPASLWELGNTSAASGVQDPVLRPLPGQRPAVTLEQPQDPTGALTALFRPQSSASPVAFLLCSSPAHSAPRCHHLYLPMALRRAFPWMQVKASTSRTVLSLSLSSLWGKDGVQAAHQLLYPPFLL